MYSIDTIRALKRDDVIYVSRPGFTRYGFNKTVTRRYVVIHNHVEHHGMIMYGVSLTSNFRQSTPDYLSVITTRIVPSEQVRHRRAPDYQFAASDGGRTDAGIQDRRDCSVRAVALALDVPYQTAHDYLSGCGRKNGHGVYIDSVYRNLQLDGKRLVCAARAKMYGGKGIRMTVNAWLKSGILPDRCIMQIRGHVFAVVSGKVLDTFKPGARSIVLSVWEVVNIEHGGIK